MPVIKCSNGKWRIGNGGCVYDTQDKATKVWQAILASGAYAAEKVSYDYDGVLSTDKGKAAAERDIKSGKIVYVISARQSVEGMLSTASTLGIPKGRVYATGSNKAKVEKIKSLGVKVHKDNNPDVIKELGVLGIQFAESYTDYPESATKNAKRALKWVDQHGWGSCGEATGKARANQLANREPISRDTIARMASFKRHQQNKDVPYSEGCGGLMWDCWGGTSGIEWAINKLKEIDNK
jgi:hypothetical protein